MDLSSETLAKRPAMEAAVDAALDGLKATPQTWSWCSFITCSRVRILASQRRTEKSQDPAGMSETTSNPKIVHSAQCTLWPEWHQWAGMARRRLQQGTSILT